MKRFICGIILFAVFMALGAPPDPIVRNPIDTAAPAPMTNIVKAIAAEMAATNATLNLPDFTIVQMGDLQNCAATATGRQYVTNSFSYLIAMKSALNIKALVLPGDLTDDGTDETMWLFITNQLARLYAAGIPFYASAGNHDKYGGSHTAWNNHMAAFMAAQPGYESRLSASDYYAASWFQTNSGLKLNFIALGYATNATDFANIAAFGANTASNNADHISIFLTHGYLSTDSIPLFTPDTGYDSGINGIDWWSNCFKIIPSSAQVLCGHDHPGTFARLTQYNDWGTRVDSVLFNEQDSANGGGNYIRFYRWQPNHNWILAYTVDTVATNVLTTAGSYFLLPITGVHPGGDFASTNWVNSISNKLQGDINGLIVGGVTEGAVAALGFLRTNDDRGFTLTGSNDFSITPSFGQTIGFRGSVGAGDGKILVLDQSTTTKQVQTASGMGATNQNLWVNKGVTAGFFVGPSTNQSITTPIFYGDETFTDAGDTLDRAYVGLLDDGAGSGMFTISGDATPILVVQGSEVVSNQVGTFVPFRINVAGAHSTNVIEVTAGGTNRFWIGSGGLLHTRQTLQLDGLIGTSAGKVAVLDDVTHQLGTGTGVTITNDKVYASDFITPFGGNGFIGKIATGSTNASGSPVAFQSDITGTGGHSNLTESTYTLRVTNRVDGQAANLDVSGYLRVRGTQTNDAMEVGILAAATNVVPFASAVVMANAQSNLVAWNTNLAYGSGYPGNSASVAGIVSAGTGNNDKVWKTDGSGVPGWRDDATGGAPSEATITNAIGSPLWKNITGNAGTASIATNALSMTNVMRVYNVMDYGATTNAGTDATAAFQQADNAAYTNNGAGGIVYVPPGIYTINGTVTNWPGVHIIGAGSYAGGSQINKTGTGETIHLYNGRCVIQDLYLHGPDKSTAVFGIRTRGHPNGTAYFTLNRVRADGFRSGFYLDYAWSYDVFGCWGILDGDGITMTNANNAYRVIGGEYSQNTNGIHQCVTGAGTTPNGGEITATFQSNNTGYQQDDTVAGGPGFAFCHFESNTNAMRTTNSYGLSINGGFFSATKGTNILLHGTGNGIEVHGAYFASPAENALIHSDSGVANVTWGSGIRNENNSAVNILSMSGPGIRTPAITTTTITNTGVAYFGSSGQTTIAADGAISGSGTGLTSVPTNAIDSTFFAWINSKGTGSGGGGTNSSPIALSFSDTNVAVSCTTPLGCVTNAPLHFTLSMTTNALIQNPTGMGDGQRIVIEFIQDATGSRLGYFDTDFAFGSDITACTLTTTASKRDFATFIYTNSKWYCVGFVRGY